MRGEGSGVGVKLNVRVHVSPDHLGDGAAGMILDAKTCGAACVWGGGTEGGGS